MSNDYDWIVDLQESTTIEILQVVGDILPKERQPTAQAMMEAIIQLFHGLYGPDITMETIAEEMDLPKETITEIRHLIARKTKGTTMSDNKPTPKQPERPIWLQHSSNTGLLDIIVSISHGPQPNDATMLPALEEYITRVGLHQAIFDIVEADADGGMISSLGSMLQNIWERYTRDHNDRSIPF